MSPITKDALSKAVDAATAAGKIVVAAAGNSGDGPGTITSPGSAVTAITVGAVAEWSAQSGAQYRSEGPYLAAFSSRGPTIDDRIKPDVVAPGVTVGAAKAGSTSTYVVESGTSMATTMRSAVVRVKARRQASMRPGFGSQALLVRRALVDSGRFRDPADRGVGVDDTAINAGARLSALARVLSRGG